MNSCVLLSCLVVVEQFTLARQIRGSVLRFGGWIATGLVRSFNPAGHDVDKVRPWYRDQQTATSSKDAKTCLVKELINITLLIVLQEAH